MYPYLQIGQRAVSSYQACLMLAFAVCAYLLFHAPLPARQRPLRINVTVLIPVLLCSLTGAKFLSVAVEGGRIGEAFLFWRGGYYHHGGLLGGIAGYAVYLWAKGNGIRDGLDWVAPFAPLGESIARIGCFLGGCCWGAESQALTAVVYPAQSHAWTHHVITGRLHPSATHSLPVHPAPLYAALVMLSLFIGLRLLQQRAGFSGEVSLHYLLWHSLARIGLEHFRDDMTRLATGYTLTQTLAAAIAVAAAAVLLRQYARNATYSPLRPTGAQPQEDTG